MRHKCIITQWATKSLSQIRLLAKLWKHTTWSTWCKNVIPTFFSPPDCSSGPAENLMSASEANAETSHPKSNPLVSRRHILEISNQRVLEILTWIELSWKNFLSQVHHGPPGTFNCRSSTKVGRPPLKLPTLMVLQREFKDSNHSKKTH